MKRIAAWFLSMVGFGSLTTLSMPHSLPGSIGGDSSLSGHFSSNPHITVGEFLATAEQCLIAKDKQGAQAALDAADDVLAYMNINAADDGVYFQNRDRLYQKIAQFR